MQAGVAVTCFSGGGWGDQPGRRAASRGQERQGNPSPPGTSRQHNPADTLILAP